MKFILYGICILAGIIMLFLYIFIIWRIPNCLYNKSKIEKTDKKEFRKILLQVTGGAIIVVGVILSLLEFRQSKEEFDKSQVGQIASQYSSSIKLIDKPILNITGGMYSLENTAREYPNYLQTVLDTITTFIRNPEYFRYPGKEGNIIKFSDILKKLESIKGENINSAEKEKKKTVFFASIELPFEMQAVLTILGRVRYEVIKKKNPEIFSRIDGLEEKKEDKPSAKLEKELELCKSDLIDSFALYHVILNEVYLFRADLRNADLIKAELRKATIWDSKLRHAKLWEADLRDAKLNGECDLRNADFFKADLRNAQLINSRSSKACFKEAKLQGIDISYSDLLYADFREAKLQNAILIAAVLNEADLRGADLSGAKLQFAKLIGANLSGATLRGTHLNKAVINRAKLLNADFREADFSGVKGFTIEQLKKVKSLYKVKGLSREFTKALEKEKPALFEKPD